MQMQNTEDFDLQIRSMLEDAEVKPSRRVWKAVSSRLQAERGTFFPVWARWAGAGLAACAAALGIMLTLHRQEDPILTINYKQDRLLAQTAPVAVSEPAAVNHPDKAVSSGRKQMSEMVVTVPAGEPASEVEILPVQRNSVQEQEVFTETEETEQNPVRVESVAANEPEPEDTMPIVWEEEGEKPAFNRLQLYAQGVLLANESDFRFASRRAYGSAGLSQTKTGIYELEESSYGIPLSAGVGVRFYVTPKLAIGTGLDYSYLSRTFKGQYVNEAQGIDQTGTVTHSMHYLGIPLNVSYDFVSAKKVLVYAHFGVEAEYCLSNKYRIVSSGTYDYSYAAKGLQWSVGAGIGVQFRITDGFGLYLDPGLRYYFNCNQPKNIRTDKPLMVNFDAGIRFNF